MKILVTGANGQLGNEMRLVSRQSSDQYIFTDVNQVEGLETTYLDITDLEAIREMVKREGANAIVNCAAWTNVDAAETNQELCEKLNAVAPENLAIAMKEVNGMGAISELYRGRISADFTFSTDFWVSLSKYLKSTISSPQNSILSGKLLSE